MRLFVASGIIDLLQPISVGGVCCYVSWCSIVSAAVAFVFDPVSACVSDAYHRLCDVKVWVFGYRAIVNLMCCSKYRMLFPPGDSNDSSPFTLD